MGYRLFLKGSTAQRLEDGQIRNGDPPFEGDVLEVTFMRERMKVRVLYVYSLDPVGSVPAEVTLERIR
jgi:hypothetical protein